MKWNEIEQTTIKRKTINQPTNYQHEDILYRNSGFLNFFYSGKLVFFPSLGAFFEIVCLVGWLVDKLLDWNNHHHHHQNGNEHHQQIYFFVFFFSSIISMKQWSKKERKSNIPTINLKQAKLKLKRREEKRESVNQNEKGI